MNMHKNARLTPSGRALLADRVASGWTVKAAAGAAGRAIKSNARAVWVFVHAEGLSFK